MGSGAAGARRAPGERFTLQVVRGAGVRCQARCQPVCDRTLKDGAIFAKEKTSNYLRRGPLKPRVKAVAERIQANPFYLLK